MMPMSVFRSMDEPGSGASGRTKLMAALAAAVVVASAAALWWASGREASPPATRVERAAPPPPAPAPAPRAAEMSAPRPEPAAPRAPAPRRRDRAPAPEPAPEAPAPAPGPELRVETDVAGALVFLDRKFLGNAPVSTRDVTPGPHQLNVSAEGYEGIARTIEVKEAEPTEVVVRLKEVRLDASVDVVHKHAVGSCAGRLTADLSGFRFVPSRGDDGFVLPFEAVEAFEIDYLKKNLRLKRKGGRTWNFESPTGSADPLFVFHRDVEKARAKLQATR
jgi:hypothetical protein